MTTVLVAFGSNLGDRTQMLREGLRRLRTTPGWTLLSASSLYETLPVGGPEQGPFLNACALFSTADDARSVLRRLLEVESALGRRRTGRDHPRTLDLDLLLFGEEVLRKKGLEVPHPRMTERGFVMAPAAEIAADLVHPSSGINLGEWAERLHPMQGVARHAPRETWT